MGSTERLLETGGIVEIWQDKIKSYIRRNWRSRIPAYPLKPPTLRITASNYVYNTQRKKVIEEIRAILGHDDITTKDISRLRHRAVRNIIEAMSDEDYRELQKGIDKAKIEGYSPSVQKSHDYSADRLNVQADNFVTEHASDVESIGIQYEAYLKTLLALRQGRNQGPVQTEPSQFHAVDDHHQGTADARAPVLWTDMLPGESAEEHAKRLGAELRKRPLDGTIPLTNDGFPILPTPWPNTLPKKILDKYYQRYMYAHY
ncbi:hypothetical protein CVT24_003155, partial [Panaeolus cyanescens]